MLKGTDFKLLEKMRKLIKIPIIAGGGIGSIEDIKKIKKLKIDGVIVSSILHDNKIKIGTIKKNKSKTFEYKIKMKKIGIINYGTGNLENIKNVLDHLKVKFKEISSSNEIKNIDKIILPGVGNFGYAIKNISNNRIKNKIEEFKKVENIIWNMFRNANFIR